MHVTGVVSTMFTHSHVHTFRISYTQSCPSAHTYGPAIHTGACPSTLMTHMRTLRLILLVSTQVTKSSMFLVTWNAGLVTVSVPTRTWPWDGRGVDWNKDG